MPSVDTYFDPKTKIWASKERPYTFGDRGLGEVIMEALNVDPDLVLEINHDTGFELTRKQLKKMSVDVARNMQQFGVQPDDLVLLLIGDQDYSSALLLATTFIGAVFCDLELGLDYDNMLKLVRELQPKLVITERSELDTVKKVLRELELNVPLFVADDHMHSDSVQQLLLDRGPVDSFKVHEIRDVENKVAAVVSSSATAGVYKLVNISHPMLMHNYTSDFGIIKTTFSFSGLNWITGIVLIIGSIIVTGIKRIHTKRPFSPELLLDIIEKREVHLVILQPDRLNATLTCDKIKSTNFDSLFVVMVTGKPLSTHMKAKLEKYLTSGGVVTTYGMTETAGTITSSLYSSGKEGSTGILVDNCKAKIVGDDGENKGPDEVGEIHILTEFKFLGYYKNEKMTAESVDNEGFIRTGDMGYFDEDGELFIVDRKKDTIVCGDKFVFPSVLEAIITQHPGVYDCCIIDVVHPDLNFVPLAAVIRQKGSSVTENDIIDFVAQRQPAETSLKGGVIFVEELPKTSTGKFKRYQVRKLVDRSISAPAGATSR